jgi:excinuclease UvrABC nuclease subunit
MTDVFAAYKAHRSAALQALEDARSVAGLPTEIPADSGHLVYVAKTIDGTVLYVGMTRNLWQRITNHGNKSRWFKDAHTFALLPCRSLREAQRLESTLIVELQPAHNLRSW